MEYHVLSRGPDKELWIRSFANNLDRLAQGVGKRMLSGTNTIFFISSEKNPDYKKVN